MSVSDELPDRPAVRLAREVADHFQPPALRNHCLRSYAFAALRARRVGIAFDEELLAVAALLHDLGLTPAFDSHTLPFEAAGGDVGWVFAAGAGWTAERRGRLREIVVRHMGAPVAPDDDPEGHLLQFSTSLDISGRGIDTLPIEDIRTVLARHPRLDLPERFTACFRDQAARKPGSAAAAAMRDGVSSRLATNPLDQVERGGSADPRGPV